MNSPPKNSTPRFVAAPIKARWCVFAGEPNRVCVMVSTMDLVARVASLRDLGPERAAGLLALMS